MISQGSGKLGGIFIIARSIKHIIEIILAISLGLTAIFVFINVILRYVFGSGLTWAVELSSILFLVIIVLGSVLAMIDENHIKVDVLTNAVNKKWKKILAIVATILTLVALTILGLGSYTLMMENIVLTTPVLGISQAYIYGMGVFLSVALAVAVINNVIKFLRKKDEPIEQGEE
ncbi:MAG: TRAP transporter small permease [Solibacillus sp.]